MAELHASPLHRRTFLITPVRQDFPRSILTWDFVSVKGHARIPFKPCRCFRSDEGRGVVEKMKGNVSKNEKLCGKIGLDSKGDSNELLGAIRSFVWRFSKPSSRSKALEQLEEKLSWVAVQFARYFVTMMSTGVILLIGFQLSGGDSQMNELIWYSWLGGIIIGTMIGSNMVLEEVSRAGPRNVVITGSTRGLGKALAREFLLSGDRVVVASRSPESVNETIKELEENLQQLSINSGSSSSKEFAQAKVVGIACDVSVPADVRKLANYSIKELGSIDIWVNNAGTNKGFRPLLQFADDDIQQIVSTNLVGSILCTREAMKIMQSQKRGGHIFNMDGAGSGGSSTPLTAVYGSTKCGLRQLQSSLLKESRRSNVGVHTASPGMVLTDLLLSGSSIKNKQMFNIICELPETVARTLVPRMRVVKGSGKAINYLTPPRILLALVTAWLRRGRWFDDQVSFNQIFSKLRIVSNQYWCFLVRGLHLLFLWESIIRGRSRSAPQLGRKPHSFLLHRCHGDVHRKHLGFSLLSFCGLRFHHPI